MGILDNMQADNSASFRERNVFQKREIVLNLVVEVPRLVMAEWSSIS